MVCTVVNAGYVVYCVVGMGVCIRLACLIACLHSTVSQSVGTHSGSLGRKDGRMKGGRGSDEFQVAHNLLDYLTCTNEGSTVR